MRVKLQSEQAEHAKKSLNVRQLNKNINQLRANIRALTEQMGYGLPYDDDPKWNASFARSLDVLDRLSQEAHEDYLAGRTEPCDPVSDEV